MIEAVLPGTREYYNSEADCYTVMAGNKILRVHFGESEISTLVLNTGNTAMPGETTAVYLRAKELMQKRANEQGRPLTYTFTTIVPTMMEWAKTKGQQVFGWEQQNVNAGYKASLVFEPQANTAIQHLL